MIRQFEQLEKRRLMAGDFDLVPITPILVLQQPLVIEGTNAADNIAISRDGFGNIVVNNNGSVASYWEGWISRIVVNAHGGADTVNTAWNIGRPMEIRGGYGNDILWGGDLADLIEGGGDTDTIYGRDGNDNLDGGIPGFTSFWENTGHDYLDGGLGGDSVSASDVGNCTLVGSDGDDYLYGAQGNDRLYGGWGNDYLYGNAGNDVITGYTGNDVIFGGDGDDTLRGEWDNDVVCGNNGNDVVHGDSGNDNLYGDNGNDKLYGGAGADNLYGGFGNDVLVTIGGGQSDSLFGQGDFDSFWSDSEGTECVFDASYAEAVGGNVHRVGSFMTERFTNGSGSPASWTYQTPGRDLNGNNFRDPDGGSNYANFSDRPLFSASGPTKDDVDQNGLSDCYFLAPLSSVAKVNPNKIRQSVVELGDGTYGVRFYNGGSEVYLRVDGDLPRDGMGNLSYAGLGVGNSTWVAVMEKAWAHFRKNEGRWGATEWGWMDECYSALGSSTGSLNVDGWYKFWNNSGNLWSYVRDRLSEGQSVTIGTNSDAVSPLAGSHAYMVDYVYYSGTTPMVRLRNPWSGTGAGDAGAYVHVTAQQLFNNISRVQHAYV